MYKLLTFPSPLLFSNLPSEDDVFQLAQNFFPDIESFCLTMARLRPKIDKAKGGIFAFCFDGTDSADLSCDRDKELLIVSLLREELLKSAQRCYFFSYCSSLNVEDYNTFDLHKATVNSFCPRCTKYSSSPRSISFVGDLGGLFQDEGWSSIMRPLCVGITGVISSWEKKNTKIKVLIC